ncbi:unnamed protein product, partial [Rotaria sp. Silwood2]
HPFYMCRKNEIFTCLVALVIRNLCQFYENSFGTATLREKLQTSLEEIINSM